MLLLRRYIDNPDGEKLSVLIPEKFQLITGAQAP
jgi:hypothetical protein